MTVSTEGRQREIEGSSESGAALVLALIFMVASALLVVALVTWSGNALTDVAAYQQGRSVNYAANSAMEVAIQSVRYSTTACPSGGLQIPVGAITMDIWCSPNPETEAATAASRVITFTACTSTAVAAGTCSSAKPYLQVVVTYDDYSSSAMFAFGAGQLCASTCGTTMTINSWTFENTAL